MGSYIEEGDGSGSGSEDKETSASQASESQPNNNTNDIKQTEQQQQTRPQNSEPQSIKSKDGSFHSSVSNNSYASLQSQSGTDDNRSINNQLQDDTHNNNGNNNGSNNNNNNNNNNSNNSHGNMNVMSAVGGVNMTGVGSSHCFNYNYMSPHGKKCDNKKMGGQGKKNHSGLCRLPQPLSAQGEQQSYELIEIPTSSQQSHENSNHSSENKKNKKKHKNQGIIGLIHCKLKKY